MNVSDLSVFDSVMQMILLGYIADLIEYALVVRALGSGGGEVCELLNTSRPYLGSA